jgi:hypothetical protein
MKHVEQRGNDGVPYVSNQGQLRLVELGRRKFAEVVVGKGKTGKERIRARVLWKR